MLEKQKSGTALLLIDFINNLDFPEGELLEPQGVEAALKTKELKSYAKELGIPVIYVNDNYGKWKSDFGDIVKFCTSADSRGKEMSETVLPEEDDYFILKPQFSGFFKTQLSLLLGHLEVKNLILTGVAGDKCIHFTANDAYMRGYDIRVPKDCTASNYKESNERALTLLADVLGVDTTTSDQIRLAMR
ncbi:cysteine hydrolase family protein [Natribacillus halophilus]|uniref:Nicotinamidase-related amidase n=1 Tax=Natribacillus halophilus TaxID=549003 RepID=A0A1G8RIK8_9BACI|nr:isochorismatase family cysteine hydrolase [Natribacillus halophilus]SDJ16816.1 Nicotinamidase-related amidase [Natribacillus halophilus]